MYTSEGQQQYNLHHARIVSQHVLVVRRFHGEGVEARQELYSRGHRDTNRWGRRIGDSGRVSVVVETVVGHDVLKLKDFGLNESTIKLIISICM